MAFLFFGNNIGDNFCSIESEIEIELSEKEFEDKSEKEKEVEKEVEKDHFYTSMLSISFTDDIQNHFTCAWISANSAFCEIISPPPDTFNS